MELPKLKTFDFPAEFEAVTFTVIVDKAGDDPQHYAYLVQGWRPMLEAVARENYQRYPVHNDEQVWLECCILELLEVFGDVEAWDQATTSDFKPFRCVWQTGSITGNGRPLRKITVVRLFENELERALLQHGFPGGLRPGEVPTYGGYKKQVVALFLKDVATFLAENDEWSETWLLRAAKLDHRLISRIRAGMGFRINSIERVAATMNFICDGSFTIGQAKAGQTIRFLGEDEREAENTDGDAIDPRRVIVMAGERQAGG